MRDGTMHTLERTFELPDDAPQKLLDDIARYSALVEMQAKMSGPSSWYAKLN